MVGVSASCSFGEGGAVDVCGSSSHSASYPAIKNRMYRSDQACPYLPAPHLSGGKTIDPTVHNSTVRSLTVYSWAVCHGVGFIGVPAVPGTGGRDSNHRFSPQYYHQPSDHQCVSPWSAPRVKGGMLFLGAMLCNTEWIGDLVRAPSGVRSCAFLCVRSCGPFPLVNAM